MNDISMPLSSLTPRVMDTSPCLGMGPAALHELYAATEADASATTGAGLALTLGASAGPLLWVRQDFLGHEAGMPYPPGLMEFGFDPARIIFVCGKDPQSVLQAGLEGARCAALGAVLIELRGEVKALDLTASRRLALAAKASGIRLVMARVGVRPCPSAAETRWEVRAAPSRALAANAPGNPAFSLTLLRHRGGLSHEIRHWEWNRDTRSFENRAAGSTIPSRIASPPPVSGPVVPVSFDGQVSPRSVGPSHRQAG